MMSHSETSLMEDFMTSVISYNFEAQMLSIGFCIYVPSRLVP